MKSPTWNAYSPYGNLLASFGSKDLAEAYRDQRAAIGLVVTVRRVWLQGRAA